MIEVKHLTKRFGAYTAVDDLCVSADAGRIYGFLGPNGAGKTTTMNIMTGYLAATDGTVLVDGLDVQKEPEEAKKRIGYLPEVPPLYADMTVEEYLLFSARLKKIPRAQQSDAVWEAMAASEVEDEWDRLIRNLSKGYQQRVGLAQALIGNPPILILDEPTAGMDPEQQRQMFDYIRLFKKDHTIILSSHILSDISAVADYIWILSNGRMVASDTTRNLLLSRQTSQEVKLHAMGNAEGIKKALADLAVVSSVEVNKQEGEIFEFTIISESGEDIRPLVSRTAVYAGAAILDISAAKSSLEDVFLQLTGAPEDGGEKGREPVKRKEEKSRRNGRKIPGRRGLRKKGAEVQNEVRENPVVKTDAAGAASAVSDADGEANIIKETSSGEKKEDAPFGRDLTKEEE